MSACIEGLLMWPMFEVVCLGSRPAMTACGLIRRNASITTLPFTDWIGSMTTATDRGSRDSNDYQPISLQWKSGGNLMEKHTCWVLMSTLDSQHPKPGCEWYHPTTISGLMERRRCSAEIPGGYTVVLPSRLFQHVCHSRLEDVIH